MGYDVDITSGRSLTDIIRHLEERGHSGPPRAVIAALDMAALHCFADTQARTHVITGSLKLSGRYKTDFDGNDWTVLIEYGGMSKGPNNPVDYAIFELARGGSHFFFSGVPGFEHEYDHAILQFFD